MKVASFLFAVLFAASLTFAQSDMASRNTKGDPVPADTIPPQNFPFPTAFNFNYAGVPGVSGGTVGAMFLNGKYYLNRWNSTMMYRYNPDGPGGGPGTLADSGTYQGSVRDLTTDGTYLYGGNAATAVYKIDPATLATLSTITLTGGSTRAIAYDPNRNGIWNTGFGGNLFLHSMTGTLITSIPSTLTGKYGMGWDSIAGQPAYLWVWNQGTGSTTNTLHKYNIQTGLEEANYTFTLTGASTGIAGGAEVCVVNNKVLLLLNYQNFALVGYYMRDLNIIPVEFSSFSAAATGNNVVLNWTTATEKNNSGFEILRKSESGDYKVIGFVNGNGTSTSPNNYSYIDNTVQTGKYSYRLRQIDYDGSSAFSSVVEVDINAPSQFNLSQNYPNPFNPATTINFSLAVDSKVSVKVFNSLGEEVSILTEGNFQAGTHNLNFNASNLTSGVYVYTIEASGIDGTNFKSTKKMILNK
ncbi:MAG: T9SS type A sorting domain-containing protein [Ignavibacteriaceae bacterium]|nr:T9SS type A sorting domain-containing protein [Ignavibacteriaceae bacterium]